MPEGELLDALDEARGFVKAEGAFYVFSHAIVQRAIAEDTTPARRARAHRAMAEALAAKRPEASAEIAAQYAASSLLPGADAGVPFAIAAAKQARRASAPERAVKLLRLARDLGGDVSADLAVAEAEALLIEDALRDVEGSCDPVVLGAVARALKEAGAPLATWSPLVARGLAEAKDDASRAPLLLLRERVDPIPMAPYFAGVWVHPGGDVVHPFALRSREELARVGDLDMAGRQLLYWYADYREARDTFGMLLEATTRVGSIPGQAEALMQLTICALAMGDLAAAAEMRARADATVARLGTSHRLHVLHATGMPTWYGQLTGGDTAPMADAATRFVSSPEAARSPIALMVAGFGALAHALAGNAREAEALLRAMRSAFAATKADVLVRGVALGCAVHALHILEQVDLARDYLALERGGSRGILSSPQLDHARLLATVGDAGADRAYSEARSELRARGQRPAAAIATREHALLTGARALEAEAVREMESMGIAVPRKTALPDGLTAREAEVLRLLARGLANKEIAAQLFVSVATVERHLANAYAKIGARGRAQATAYAIKHGL
jgi:DNA-binding NarL/FixJ family response regulator